MTAFTAVNELNLRTDIPLSNVKVISKTAYATLHKINTEETASAASSRILMPPTIAYDFSCSCRENPPGSEGNATTTENGQLIDFVEVSSMTGENWTVVSAEGFFDISSLQPPFSPTIITPGTPLDESGGPGVYQLMGIHVEAVGYTLTVTNETDTLSIGAAVGECAYPNPEFVDLNAGYCLSSPAFTLSADNGGLIGTGEFTILNDDGSTNTADAVTFDPAALGIGTYILRYSFEETDACAQAIEQTVDVTDDVGTMSCNDNLQISLQDNCELELTADMLLEGNFDSYSVFLIEIYDGPFLIDNPITDAYSNQELTFKVINTCASNFCDGTIVVEDKLAPIIDCPTAIISIDCTTNANTIPAPTATDNCDGVISPVLISSNTEDLGCEDADGLISRTTRTYTAIDSKGNQVQDNCIQIIEVERADLINVTFPSDAVFNCGTNPITLPANTGRPMLNGVDIINNNICNFYSFYTDNVIETCGDSYKIVRSWTILDWCNNSSTPTNTILAEQIIKIQDITPPTITCPQNFEVSTNTADCTADFTLSTANIIDNCGTFSSQIFSPSGPVTAGQVSGFNIGTHLFIFSATDECGNYADCPTSVTVTDEENPIMVCDEITQVTLNPEGTADIEATTFDDGSYDACTSITFLVRRVDENGIFTPTVNLACTDAAAAVLVELQGTDAFGNSNTCEVQVLVEDNSAPTLSCAPNDITIDCTQNFEDFFTVPTITEACGIFPTAQVTNNVTNSCGQGIATRTYTITDANSNTSTCTQTITIENNNVLTLADIDFPDDFDSAICGTSISSLDPDSLPVNSQRPIVNEIACSEVNISLNEEIFETDGACLTIERTWTVVNWCNYDPANPTAGGIFSDTQYITVTDNEAPFLVCPPNPFVKIINPSCDTTIFVFGPDTLMDNCSQNIHLSSTLQRTPTDDPANILMSSPSLGFYDGLLPGLYEVNLFADDGCGNVAVCDYILSVQDNKVPTPYCFDTLIIGIMDNGMIDFNARCFNAGSFDNCTAPEDLLFSHSLNPFDSIRTFTCADIGFIPIEMHVTDEGFNTDKCAVTLKLQDLSNFCDGERSISGYMRTEILEEVADVMVSVNDDIAITSSDEEGYYSVDVAANGDYTLLPEKDINPKNGITTVDVVLIRQHVLGLQVLNSPYKIIAADVNNTGTVTTSDVVALRRLILGLDDNFSNNTSWRFVDASFDFPNPQNPFESGFPEFININDLDVNVEDANFVAVKIGDINNTVNGLNFSGNDSDERSSNDLIFDIKNETILAGETKTLWFENAQIEDLVGLQGTISFDASILSLNELITDTGLQSTSFSLLQKETGNIGMSWENAALSTERIRFGLNFTARQTTTWDAAISLTNELLQTEIYRQSGSQIGYANAVLNFSDSYKEGFLLKQNTPNPFSTETTISFKLPADGNARLSIFDAAGRMIFVEENEYSAGLQEIKIMRADLGQSSGLLFYRLESGDFTSHRRMILH